MTCICICIGVYLYLEYVTLIAVHAARKRDATVPGGTAYYRRFGLCHGEVQALRPKIFYMLNAKCGALWRDLPSIG